MKMCVNLSAEAEKQKYRRNELSVLGALQSGSATGSSALFLKELSDKGLLQPILDGLDDWPSPVSPSVGT